MNIFAIGDLHLSFGVPGKDMAVFGLNWKEHYNKIATHWDEVVSKDDLVLLPGDISWAMKSEDVAKDLAWIAERPGTKVMIRGNHDYWWDTIAKVRKILPPSILAIGNDALSLGGIAIGGARLWDSSEYSFMPYIDMRPNTVQKADEVAHDDDKIFSREIGRLKMSLLAMDKSAKTKIVLTHYPPIGADLSGSIASHLFEEFGINHVVFGHLHSLKPDLKMFGFKNGVHYHLVSADYLHFNLSKIV